VTLAVTHDVSPLLAGATGVARYGTTLSAHLQDLGVRIHRIAFGRSSFAPPAGTRHWPIPLRVVHAAWRRGVPLGTRPLRGQLLHTLDLAVPPSDKPVVATVHDLLALERPDLHPERSVRQQEEQLRSLERAAMVFANSQATRDSLIAHGVPDDKIVVTHLGVESVSELDVEPRSSDDVLYVGEPNRRKGFDVLVEAVASAPPGSFHVVHAGLAATAAPGVRSAGQVSEPVLQRLYRTATVLCFPSRAEGFGLPVLEAMAAGLPVVASDIPAVREVAGPAAVLVPPGDAEALREALLELLGDPDRRGALAEAGRRRAAGFSWRTMAEATLAGYRAVLACA
jgi:glycosyltransferase involved in cell wall biosynthesis